MRLKSPELYLQIILTLCWSVPSFAQQTGSITGKILDEKSKALPLATIYLKETRLGTISDEKGFFVLTSVEGGTYTLVASSIGYSTTEKQVLVTPGKETAVQFALIESTSQLGEVTVIGVRGLNEQVSSIGKSGIRSLDLPQSVMTITKDVLEQQQTLRLSDAIKNVNGLYVMGTTGGNQEELAGRGFAYNSSNTFKNGSRFNNGILPEMSSLERVEVMKGSNAILFGNVAAGGIINLVTKKPKFENGGEVSMRMGSYDFYKPSLDVYGTLDEKKRVAYRVNTTYENTRSFRDEVASRRFYINPSFLVKAGQKTEVLIEADYLEDRRTSDYGTGAIDYTIAPIPRSRFLGATWSYFDADQTSLTATINHQINSIWKVRMVNAVQNYKTDLFGTTRPNANNQFIQEDGKWIRGLQRTEVQEKYYLSQLDLTGSFQTGSIHHSVLVGADFDTYNTETVAYTNLAKYDSINIFDLELYKQRKDIPELSKRTLTKGPTQRTGIYAQDLVSLTEKFKVLAGVRYTYMTRVNNVYTFATKTTPESSVITNVNEGAFTPRFGLVYQPVPTTSFFASYANSFNLNSGIDVNSKPLAPSYVDQYEVGVKNDLFKGLLSANVTAYQIVNSNFAQTVIIPPGNSNNIPANAQELAGEVTSKGIEVDVMRKSYHGLSTMAGYSFNETRYTKSNIYEEGSKLRYNPQHTGNLSLYYSLAEHSFLKHFNIGTGLFYTGNRVAGRSTRTTIPNDSYELMPIPDFLTVDASIGYVAKRFSIRARMSNLFNALSYYVHDDNSVNPIAPRMLSTTLSIKM